MERLSVWSLKERGIIYLLELKMERLMFFRLGRLAERSMGRWWLPCKGKGKLQLLPLHKIDRKLLLVVNGERLQFGMRILANLFVTYLVNEDVIKAYDCAITRLTYE
jgi:hypothetical protein